MANPATPTTDSVSDNVIASYSEALKRSFTSLKKRYRPDFRGVGNQDDAMWRKAALMLAQSKGHPYAYMKFAFETMARCCDDVYPRMVTSPKMVERFFAERVGFEKELELTVSLQRHYLKAQLAQGSTLETVLKNPNAQFSAVFSYAAAKAAGRPDLAELFRKEAELTLLFEPHYQTLLGRWIGGQS